MNASLLIENLVKYQDINGLIVQRDGDGGDSAYRTALAAVLCFLNSRYVSGEIYTYNLVKNCRVKDGVWVRHPDKNEWYSNPDNFSRDQMAKVMLCMLVYDGKQDVINWLKAQAKRFGFHQNKRHNASKDNGKFKMPDIISPGEIANLIRGLDLWLLFPLLIVLDIKFLLDLYFRKKTPWDYDSLMAIDLVYAQIIMPTPISRLAAKLYKNTDYKYRILNNYADINNGIEPLGELYVLTCERVFEK